MEAEADCCGPVQVAIRIQRSRPCWMPCWMWLPASSLLPRQRPRPALLTAARGPTARPASPRAPAEGPRPQSQRARLASRTLRLRRSPGPNQTLPGWSQAQPGQQSMRAVGMQLRLPGQRGVQTLGRRRGPSRGLPCLSMCWKTEGCGGSRAESWTRPVPAIWQTAGPARQVLSDLAAVALTSRSETAGNWVSRYALLCPDHPVSKRCLPIRWTAICTPVCSDKKQRELASYTVVTN